MATVQLDDHGIVMPCSACRQQNRLAYNRLGNAARCGRCQQAIHAPDVPIEIASPADFDRLVAHASLPIVVDYWAPWCAPAARFSCCSSRAGRGSFPARAHGPDDARQSDCVDGPHVPGRPARVRVQRPHGARSPASRSGRLVMDAIHAWCRDAGITSPALNAAHDGVPLCRSMGGVVTARPMMFFPVVRV